MPHGRIVLIHYLTLNTIFLSFMTSFYAASILKIRMFYFLSRRFYIVKPISRKGAWMTQ